jgi:hypothetical protein
MIVFKVGDRVHLESRPDVVGVVLSIHTDWSYPIRVRWDSDPPSDDKGRCYGWSRLRLIPVIDQLAGLMDEGRTPT